MEIAPFALLPAGSRLPPVEYVIVLVLGATIVGTALARDRPTVDEYLVLALAPWMAFGATLYVAFQLQLVPPSIAPLTSSPTVYLTAAIVAGATLQVARAVGQRPLWVLAIVGGLGAAIVAAVVLLAGARRGTLSVVIPGAALVGAALLSMFAWTVFNALLPKVTERTRWAGVLVLFAHALDGVSTAVGYDLMGFGERSPLSRAIIEFAAGLPTVELIGAGWLFVVVKIALAIVAVWLISGTIREAREQGYLLLGFVAAVGLGPGTHNVLLFAVT